MRLAIAISLGALGGVAQAAPKPPAPPPTTEPDDLPVPPNEHGTSATKVELPVVPDFALPMYADASHTVRELRVHGAKFLDSTVVVRGVITWVYDCASAVRLPKETDRAVEKRINDDPTRCERAKFYIGDTATTSPEKSLWVVDVPRPYNKLELERIKRSERTLPDRCEPGAKVTVCPPYKVGDVVTLTGDFKLSSPHSERNSDGLFVYGAMRNTTRKWETPGTTWTDAEPPTAGVPPPQVHAMPVTVAPVARPMRNVIGKALHDDSMVKLAAANRAAGGKQFTDAESAYQHAARLWPGNHLAWYGLGGVYAMQARWKEAVDAFQECVQLREDVPMYEMWLGIAVYERSVAQAREDQARRENRKPEDVTPDLAVTNFERVQQRLLAAVALDPGLWRAQYYLGRIARAGGHPREAAEAFSLAIRANPQKTPPYVALAELYRRWDYTDEAIKTAMAGTQSALDLADLWFVLGMGYDDKRVDDRAIEAFTKAIEASPDHAKALFQRGQVYFRKGERAKATADLEEFVKSATQAQEFAKQQATRMLMDLAQKH